MNDIYKNIEKYKPNKKRKILIVFYNMIADMLGNKKFNPVVIQLFIRGRLNSTHYCIIKIPNKEELQHFAFNHSSDIDFRDFMNLCKKCTAKLYSFLAIDATLASDNPLRFRKNLIERI